MKPGFPDEYPVNKLKNIKFSTKIIHLFAEYFLSLTQVACRLKFMIRKADNLPIIFKVAIDIKK